MCGIGGVFDFTGRPLSAERLLAMADVRPSASPPRLRPCPSAIRRIAWSTSRITFGSSWSETLWRILNLSVWGDAFQVRL
jgi:hypothetical protein